MTEPTDDEIATLYAEQTGFALDDSPAALLDFARAVLAKWATPPAVAGEPVATIKSWTNGSYWRNYKVEWHRNDLPEGAQLYTTPQPTQPQAGAVPLTEEQRSDIATAAAGFNWTDDYVEAIDYVIDGVESLHGIRGGQHGADN